MSLKQTRTPSLDSGVSQFTNPVNTSSSATLPVTSNNVQHQQQSTGNYHLNPPTLQLPAGVSGSSTTLSSLNAMTGKSREMVTTSKESFYLTILCIYKGVVLAIFAILAIIRDRDYVASGCIFGLFACILFLQGLRKELVPILRLFQIVFAILCAYFTVNFLIETVRVCKGEPDIRYIVFPVWILLIFPTVLTVYFLQRHIDFIVETLPDFPESV